MGFAVEPDLWTVDVPTIAVLAVVLWLDGWRRVRGDAIVVRRVLLKAWTVHEPAARVGGLAMLAWWPPFVIPLVPQECAAPANAHWDFGVAVARAERRRARLAWDLAVVRFVSALLVVWIALGIPLLTARFGGMGLLRGIAWAFFIATGVAVLTANGLCTAGVRWRQAARRALPLLSPFGASRAPELLLDAVLADVGPLAALRVLLGEEGFRRWLRPWAFDALNDSGRPSAPRANGPTWLTPSAIRRLPPALLRRAVGAPNDAPGSNGAPAIAGDGHGGDLYCARCGRTFRRTTSTCRDCGDLALESFPQG